MKVCIVNNSFALGGAEKMAYELGKGLMRNVDVLDYISLDDKIKLEFEFDNNIIEIKRSNIDRILQKISREMNKYLNVSYSIFFIKPITMIRLMKILRKKEYDIVILCQGELTAMIPWLKTAVNKTKFISWQHSNFEIYTKKYYSRFLKSYLKGIIKSDVVVCLTEFDKQEFKKLNISTVCINNFVSNQSVQVSQLKNQNVIFVSRLLRETKGLDLLVEVAKRLIPGAILYVVGDGPDKLWLENYIRDENLNDKVKIMGEKRGLELENIYLNGNVFISTSKWEGFSLVIAEAMTYGLPIVSTDTIGAKEVLRNGEYGVLVKNEDKELFAKKVNNLLTSDNLQKKYSGCSLIRSKDFSKDNIFPKWLNLLFELEEEIIE